MFNAANIFVSAEVWLAPIFIEFISNDCVMIITDLSKPSQVSTARYLSFTV